MLLVGDSGIGRRFAVTQLAKEIFCTGTRTASCECYQCLQINEGTHPDFTTVAPPTDKEIKVDEIRTIIETASEFPSIAPLRLFLVDGADNMTLPAANAFLKTLEEPSSVARFFLLAERDSHVIPTIRSRCGRVRFQPLPESFVLQKVSELEEDSNKALVYARMGEGSVGRAIQYLGAGRIGLRDKMLSLISAGVRRDLPSIFSIASSVEKELPLGLRFLDHLVHDFLIVRHDPSRMINLDLEEIIKNTREKMSDESWTKLSNGLRALLARYESININLLFHTQALFVEAFGV
jgi:DNA polymerase-3 subunit delta'